MYNILVCDDEKDIVSALTIYLTTAGYQVFPAYDGTEALDLLRREDIHLVLVPGDSFGCPGHVRISYCVPTEQIQRALHKFEQLAAEYK